MASTVPYKWDFLLHQFSEGLATSWKISYESSDIGQTSLRSFKFFKIFWRLHLLNNVDFLSVEMGSFGCNNMSKNFTVGHPQEGLGWVHLQLMCSHDIEYSFLIYYMITFVMTLHCNIVYVTLYGLAYVLMEDCIYGLLICHPCIFQSEGNHGVIVNSH